MISIQIIAVGSLKEKWMREGCAEYLKRMERWCNVSVTEINECRLPDSPSQAQILQGLEKEGAAILEKVPKGSHVAALCIEGKTLSSEALAVHLQKYASDGCSSFTFLIGGSYGLSGTVKEKASFRLSMSPMTFPHQLARVMLCEQLYRALSINGNGKYHK